MGCIESKPAAAAAGAPAGDSSKKSVRLSDFRPNKVIGDFLRAVPLLANKLTDAEYDQLGGAMDMRSYADGAAVVREGDQAHEFFIIAAGTAEVWRDDAMVAPLKPGDYFGETALLQQTQRLATVKSKENLQCLALGRDRFLQLFGTNRFQVQFAKRGAVAAEKHDEDEKESVTAAASAKTPQIRDFIVKSIAANDLFKSLDEEQLVSIATAMYRVEVKAGVSVMKQGDAADNFYVVESGNFNVSISKDGAPSTVVATRGPGSSFGELALLYNSPRAATIVATQDSVVWAIQRLPFRRTLRRLNAKKIDDYVKVLERVPDMGALSSFERTQIAEALDEISFAEGTAICKQGDVGDTFYIIKSGTVKCTKVVGGKVESEITLNAGQYFGELALRNHEPRAATVLATSNCVCLCMDRKSFDELMGPLSDILAKHAGMYKQDGKAPAEASVKAVVPVVEEKKGLKQIDMKELSVIGTLGQGSFGFVQLVKEKSNPNKTYALKAIAKAQIAQLGQQEHVMNEKNAMARFDSDFLIRLYATMKDRDAIYFLLEPCLGGELFTLLRARTSFNEKTTKFYAACVVLAFEHMHSFDTLYRDLKPENLLLDSKGYIKVTDFGFAKVVKDRTYTLCGTPDYLAPEVVSGQGHGKGVDWWTLGVLIFEMLASYPPFYDEEPTRTYAKIMHGQINFPKHFSEHAQDLIRKLLHPKPSKRLGVINGGASLIKKHPFFADLDWDLLAARKLPAPIQINIKNTEDLSNFENFGNAKPTFPPYKPGPKENPNWDKEF